MWTLLRYCFQRERLHYAFLWRKHLSSCQCSGGSKNKSALNTTVFDNHCNHTKYSVLSVYNRSQFNTHWNITFFRCNYGDSRRKYRVGKNEKVKDTEPVILNQKKILIVKETDVIQLFSSNDLFIGRQKLVEARQYAKKQGCKITRLQGSRGYDGGIPSYKMISITDTIPKDTKTEKKKSLKKMEFKLSTKIDEDDFMVKVNKIKKYLENGKSVEVNITSKSKDKFVGDNSFGKYLKIISEHIDPVGYTSRSFFTTDFGDAVFVPRRNNEDMKEKGETEEKKQTENEKKIPEKDT